jgi:hypothetical protein
MRSQSNNTGSQLPPTADDSIMKRLVALLTCLLPLAGACAEIVRHPRPESDTDQRAIYPVKMLELALQKSGSQYVLQAAPLAMPQSRSMIELQGKSHFIDIAWTMTSNEREAQALPIRIPIDKGLLGWRLPLVREADREVFRHTDSLRALAAFSSGQGHDWPDTAIMRANGLPVIDSPIYELLFRMLANGQFVYFPRSLNEVWIELAARPQSKLVVADHLALHYVAPMYYFVSKDNKKLAAAITRGLERAVADGSYDQLFNHYYGDDIRRAGLEKRHVLELDNPSLPKATPLGRAELWFRPGRGH